MANNGLRLRDVAEFIQMIRKTNLYKVTYWDPDEWGTLAPGSWQIEYVVANSHQRVIDLSRKLKMHKVKSIELEQEDIVLDLQAGSY